MKTTITFLLFAIVVSGLCAQDTLVIKPDFERGKDVRIKSTAPNANHGTLPEISMATWTQSGSLKLLRSLIYFNLAEVPSNAIITKATLTLYPYTYNNNYTGIPLQGNNTVNICPITSPWLEDSVTWNTQPGIDIANAITTPSTSMPATSISYDVTSLAITQHYFPGQAYGWLMKQDDETNYYLTASFASSDHADSSMRPEIEVIYLNPTETPEQAKHHRQLIIYPNPASGTAKILFKGLESGGGYFEILNSAGQLVFQVNRGGNCKGQVNLDLSDLAPGLYFVRENGNVASAAKLLVK